MRQRGAQTPMTEVNPDDTFVAFEVVSAVLLLVHNCR